MGTAPPKRAPGAAPSTVASASAPAARPRRRGRADAGPFWLIRGFLVATVALAFSTLERTEVWPNRSRLIASFKAPFFIEHKVHIGSQLPNVQLLLPSAADPEPESYVMTQDLFNGKQVLLLSTPMAFSPGCSNKHIPGYMQALDKLKARGIDMIAVVAMDTPFVMHAWAEQLGASEEFLFLSDVSGQLAKSLGTTFQAGPFGLRPTRFAMMLVDMNITRWEIETGGHLESSAADKFLADLS
ncbi:hypothetical protein ABBQ32_011850 [Trebouxia sp. C0010 RCD-2024]